MAYSTFLPALTLSDRYSIRPLDAQSGSHDDSVVIDNQTGDVCIVQTVVAVSKTQAIVYCQYLKKLRSLLLPQVEQIKDCFTSDRTIIVVKKEVAGQYYSDIIDKKGRLTEKEVVLFLSQVLTVLSALHQKGIRHCHLSPNSICLQADKMLVLTNLGFFREDVMNAGLNRNSSLQSRGFALTGIAIPRDDREDLYGVLLTALILLTGQPLSILFNAQTRRWEWAAFCSVSQDLAQLLNRMLSARESDWFTSADEFLFALSLVRAESASSQMRSPLYI